MNDYRKAMPGTEMVQGYRCPAPGCDARDAIELMGILYCRKCKHQEPLTLDHVPTERVFRNKTKERR